MHYIESEKIINSIRSKDMMMFRMAISHLMDVGIRHLTPECIESTCNEIMKEDDSHSFMTNQFKCDLIRMAGELAKIDHIHLLTYISRHMYFDVGDNGFAFDHAIEIISKLIDYIEFDLGSYQACYETIRDYDVEDEDLRYIGYDYLIPNDDDDEEE